MAIWLRVLCFVILLLTGNLFCQLFSGTISEAALSCSQCHGSTGDFRPIDAAYRNISTGGFVGNHRTHMDLTATASACGTCHPGSDSYVSSHRDGKIKLSSHINNSTPTTPYNNITSAWPQTATPVMGTCSNVNCHFETTTPVWGSNPALTSCSTCHGAPPADGSHPALTGSGQKHSDYYGTTTASCVKCHSDHTADTRAFAHATSVGKRGLIVSFAAAPNNGSGSYSGDTTYPNYLPGSTPARSGSCTATYCHSKGDGNTPFTSTQTATWGGHSVAPVAMPQPRLPEVTTLMWRQRMVSR